MSQQWKQNTCNTVTALMYTVTNSRTEAWSQKALVTKGWLLYHENTYNIIALTSKHQVECCPLTLYNQSFTRHTVLGYCTLAYNPIVLEYLATWDKPYLSLSHMYNTNHTYDSALASHFVPHKQQIRVKEMRTSTFTLQLNKKYVHNVI